MDVAVGHDPGVRQRRAGGAHVAELIAPAVTLLGVADGFGTTRNGTPTAVLALATLRDFLRRRYRVGAYGRNLSPSGLRAIVLAALDHANSRLFAQSGSHEDYVGSGTSLTAVLLVGQHAVVGHVGASRAYLARLGTLETLTTDDAIFSGAAVPSALPALLEPPRAANLLWRSLGTQHKLEASISHVELLSGDKLLLCTDSVHRMIEDRAIGSAMEESERAADVVTRMLGLARARGNCDGATVVAARDLLLPTPLAGSAAARTAGARALAIALAALVALGVGTYSLRAHTPERFPNVSSTDRP